MPSHHTLAAAALLLSGTALPGTALAEPPVNRPVDSNSGSPAELATGARATPTQPATIQSPRDVASGQATGIQSPRDPASGQATGRTAAPGTQPAEYMKLGDIKGEGVRQPTTVQNAGTSSGANGYQEGGHSPVREGGVNDTTFARSTQPQSGGATNGANTEGGPGNPLPLGYSFGATQTGSVTAAPDGTAGTPGGSRQTLVMNKNCQEFEAVVAPQAGTGNAAARRVGTARKARARAARRRAN